MRDKTVLSMEAQFKQVWDKVILDEKARHDKWFAELQGEGIKVAMPDDGWVDREEKCLHFAYPYFQVAPIQKGLIVALGYPGRYRLVKLTGQAKKRILAVAPVWWYYTEVEENAAQI